MVPINEAQRNLLKGMFFGLAVGDALGTPLEFKERDTYEHITEMMGGGPFRLDPGEWTDDTSMALALAQTLIDHGMDKIELLKNFTRWYKYGEFSHNGRCFDIGTTTRSALDEFIMSEGTNDSPASTDEWASGNGGIMRLAPAVVWAHTHTPAPPEDNPYLNMQRTYSMMLAEQQSSVTHASQECLRVARIMGRHLSYLAEGNAWKWARMHLGSLPKSRDEVKSDGYVTHTWQAAAWAVDSTENFKDALVLAVNLGDDADTVGAVAGQLAGARYGYDAIPDDWLVMLAWESKLEEMFDQLCGGNHV